MDQAPETDGAFSAAAVWYAALVERVPAAAWAEPGLGDWSVRDLVGHTGRALSTLMRALAAPAERVTCHTAEGYFLATASLTTAPTPTPTPIPTSGERAADETSVFARGVAAGRALGPDPAATVHGLVRDGIDALAAVRRASRSGDPEPLVTTIVGGMPLREYVRTRTFELVVHGEDLRDAVRRCDPEAVALPAPPTVSVREAALTTMGIALERGDGGLLLSALTGRVALTHAYSVLAPPARSEPA